MSHSESLRRLSIGDRCSSAGKGTQIVNEVDNTSASSKLRPLSTSIRILDT
jgi:hypothetical protein